MKSMLQWNKDKFCIYIYNFNIMTDKIDSDM